MREKKNISRVSPQHILNNFHQLISNTESSTYTLQPTTVLEIRLKKRTAQTSKMAVGYGRYMLFQGTSREGCHVNL